MNSVLVYIAHDADEVLPGRFWAAEAPGIWGREDDPGFALLKSFRLAYAGARAGDRERQDRVRALCSVNPRLHHGETDVTGWPTTFLANRLLCVFS